MSITIDLPPAIESAVRADAEARGLDPASVLVEVIAKRYAARAEWERKLKALSEGVDSSLPPLSDEALRREGLYEDHD